MFARSYWPAAYWPDAFFPQSGEAQQSEPVVVSDCRVAVTIRVAPRLITSTLGAVYDNQPGGTMGDVAFRLNDNRLRFTVTDQAGAAINDATFELTDIYDDCGETVGGMTFPAALAYVAGSAGEYEVTLIAALALVDSMEYHATVAGVANGYTVRLDYPFIARDRTVK